MSNLSCSGRKNSQGISRREFLRYSGITIVGAGTGMITIAGRAKKSAVYVIPACEGYLAIDPLRCQGCLSCMLMCAIVHDGEANLSKSRIQILQNSFDAWPDDMVVEQCRQCRKPLCVQECQAKGGGALTADPDFGYVRRVDKDICVGCGKCFRACPFIPSKPVVFREFDYKNQKKSHKCDLCAVAPYHRDKDGNVLQGGPGGKQACVETCPMGALVYIPADQFEGYVVNLRAGDQAWEDIGYPTT